MLNFLLQGEILSTIDLTTWAGVAAVSSLIVSILKNFPWAKDRERLLAMGVGLALAIASKLLHIGFQEMPWLTLVLAGIAAGPASGVVFEHGTKAFKAQPDSKPGDIPEIKRP